jgi:hypothetical protein
VTDLDGSLWFDQGTVTIRSEGCAGAMPDEQYRLQGKFCGDQLYLRGGWWLPVMDERGFCYEDDSAEEVGIQAEENVLTVAPADNQMTGTLALQGPCAAEYEVTFEPVRDPSL